MFYLVTFYLLVFSAIEHKEPRFMIPLTPFCFLMLGSTIATYLRKCARFLRFYIYLFIAVELIMYLIYHNMQFRNWESMAYLADKSIAPHSVYTMQARDIPYYTWTHRKEYLDSQGINVNRTKVYLFQKDPTYARRRQGVPMPILHDHDYNGCFQMIDELQGGKIRPEYIITYEFACGDNFYCYQVCRHKFESIGLYELEAEFQTEIEPRKNEPFILYRKKRFVYRLKP